MQSLIKKIHTILTVLTATMLAGSSIAHAEEIHGIHVSDFNPNPISSQVLKCILEKNYDGLEYWLKESIFDPNTPISIQGGTPESPLKIAMLATNDPITTQLLIDYGADPWAVAHIEAIIYLLAKGAHLDVLKVLHRHDPALLDTRFPKEEGEGGSSVLYAASQGKHDAALELVQWLLSLDIDPNQRSSTFELSDTEKATSTPLSAAINDKRRDIMHLLIDHGASVHPVDNHNELVVNPLGIAAITGQTEIMKELIELGADIRTPIFNKAPKEEPLQIIGEAALASEWGAVEVLWNEGARPSSFRTWILALTASLSQKWDMTSDEVIEAYTIINNQPKAKFLKRIFFNAIEDADSGLVAFCLASIHPNEIVDEDTSLTVDFYTFAVIKGDPFILRLLEIAGGTPPTWLDPNGDSYTNALRNYVLYTNYIQQHPFEGVLAPACSIGGFFGGYYLAGQYLPAWMEGDVNGAIVDTAFAIAEQASPVQGQGLQGLESAVSKAKSAWDASKDALQGISKSMPLEETGLNMNAAQLAQTVSTKIQEAIGSSGKIGAAQIQLMNAGAPKKWNSFKTWADELFGGIIETTCQDTLGELQGMASFMDPTKTQAYKAIAQYLQNNNIWEAPFSLPNPMIPSQVANPAWNEAHAAAKAAKATWDAAQRSLRQGKKEAAKLLKHSKKAPKAAAAHQPEVSQVTQESLRRKAARAGIGIAGAYPSYRVCEYLGSYLDELVWGPNEQDALLAKLAQIFEANAE